MRKLIVQTKPLKQFIFGGTAWEKCRRIAFKFSKQLLTDIFWLFVEIAVTIIFQIFS